MATCAYRTNEQRLKSKKYNPVQNDSRSTPTPKTISYRNRTIQLYLELRLLNKGVAPDGKELL